MLIVLKICNRISIIGVGVVLKVLLGWRAYELAALFSLFLLAFLFQEVLFWKSKRDKAVYRK